MVPPAPPRRRHRVVLGWTVAVLAALVGITAGVAALWEVPYYTISPGSVWPTEELVRVEGTDTFASEGEIGFTTVSLSGERTSALEAFFGWLDPSVEVVDEDLILGDDTPDENRERQLQFMLDAKQQATAVALETLGYDVTVPLGARVLEVDPDLPAGGILEPGDLVVAIDGTEVEGWADVVEVISAKAPGDEISVTFERPDPEGGDPTERTATATLAPRAEDPSLPVLGIIGSDAVEFDFPFEVDIDSGAVGGPSAGLAFTLALLDVLTPEDLTGGHLVATTGTMAIDGTVGPVGGVAQKVVAARRAGVELFIVPSIEYEEAQEVAGDMTVVPADTLEEALAALEEVGVDTDDLQTSAQAALGGR